MILSYWYVFAMTIAATIFFRLLFERYELVCCSYRQRMVAYAGGTVMLICIISGYIFEFILGRVTFFKLSCFSISILLIYALGIFYDMFGGKNKRSLLECFKYLIHRKFSIEIVESLGTLGTTSYMYFFFNEERWLLKGFLTLVILNFFHIFENKPGRTVKAYYFFFAFLAFIPLRWTRELYYISFAVLSGIYFFDAYSLTAMGRSGSNVTGFVVGIMITEAISTNIVGIVILTLALLLAQAAFNSDSIRSAMRQSSIIGFMDRILTETWDRENVKS